MTELSRLFDEALDSVEVEISDFTFPGSQWRIGEFGFATATIRNNTGLILRNFYAMAHTHWGQLTPVARINGFNEKYVEEFEPNEELTMFIYMLAVSSGSGTVHLHFDAEIAKLEYDDVRISFKVEPD